MNALHRVSRLKKKNTSVANITPTEESITRYSGNVGLAPQLAGATSRSRATQTKLNSIHDSQMRLPPPNPSYVAAFSLLLRPT